MPEITHGAVTVVRAPARCDSDFVREFVPQIDSTVKNGASREIIVDLSQTTFIDSASMGALLLLEDRAKARGRSVVLANVDMYIRQTLELVNFHQVFKFA